MLKNTPLPQQLLLTCPQARHLNWIASVRLLSGQQETGWVPDWFYWVTPFKEIFEDFLMHLRFSRIFFFFFIISEVDNTGDPYQMTDKTVAHWPNSTKNHTHTQAAKTSKPDFWSQSISFFFFCFRDAQMMAIKVCRWGMNINYPQICHGWLWLQP